MVGEQLCATYLGKKSVAGLNPPCRGATTRACATDKFTVVSTVDNGTSTRVLCEVTRKYSDGVVIQYDEREFDVPHGVELMQVIIDSTPECVVMPYTDEGIGMQ